MVNYFRPHNDGDDPDYLSNEEDELYEDDYLDDDIDEEDDEYDYEEDEPLHDVISRREKRSNRLKSNREEDNNDDSGDYSKVIPQLPIMLSGEELKELKNGTCSKELFDRMQLKRELTYIHQMKDDKTWHGIQKEMCNFQEKIKNNTYKIKHRGIYGKI